MHGHFITICRKCNTVISQCRCVSNDKTIKNGLCNKCAEEEATKLIEQHGGCGKCGD